MACPIKKYTIHIKKQMAVSKTNALIDSSGT
jgi:hypothetical protein